MLNLFPKNRGQILKNDNPDIFRLALKPFLIAGVTVFAFWGLNWWLLAGRKEAGQFGDMFGAVNALFSGLAFAGVIASMLMQTEELRLQREELKETREAQQNSAKQLEEQTVVHYVTLKYQILDEIIAKLPDQIELRRQVLIKNYDSTPRTYDDSYYRSAGRIDRVLNQELVAVDIQRYIDSDEEYCNLKNALTKLNGQKDELKSYICIDNPDIIKKRIITKI